VIPFSYIVKSPIVLAVFIIASTVFAQTPTPHPNALTPDLYQFEDLTAPEISLAGNWSITSDVWGDYLTTNSGGDTLDFYVTNASYVSIYSVGFNSGAYFQLCIDGTDCQEWRTTSPGVEAQIMHSFNVQGNAHINIENARANRSIGLDMLIIGSQYVDISSISGTGGTSPTPTPNPAYIYGTISGVSGTVTTRFDVTVTAGEVAISSALLFLFFSMWSVAIIALVLKRYVWQ